MNRTIAALGLVLLLGACGGDDDPAVDASTAPDATPPRGTISMTWRIVSAGEEAACKEVGASLVDIQLVRQGEGAGESDVVNCSAGETQTRAVNVGVYDLRFDLLASNGASLLAAPIRQFGVEVNDDDDTSIGEIVFELK